MARSVHWGWLLLAYIVGSLFPFSKFLGKVGA